jgi:hypothetical protein
VSRAPLRKALGENCTKYVLGNYRWDVVLDRYRTLIESVARQGAGAAR